MTVKKKSTVLHPEPIFLDDRLKTEKGEVNNIQHKHL